MIRLVIALILFLVLPLQAISFHLSGNPAATGFTELYIDGDLDKNAVLHVFALSDGKPPSLVKEVHLLPSQFLVTSSSAHCYFIRVINGSHEIVDYAPVCRKPLPIVDTYQLYLWLWVGVIALFLWILYYFLKRDYFTTEEGEIGFSAFVRKLHFHALERGNQVVFSTGEGITASFQNFAGFLTYREMSAAARKTGSMIPLYTSDPIIHQMALEYVDNKQTTTSIVFSGGSDLTHLLLVKREVSNLDGASMLVMVGELTPRALLCTTPLTQEKHTVVAASANMDALSALLPSTAAIGIGSEMFSLLTAFRASFIPLLMRLFIVVLLVFIVVILLFSTIAFFTENGFLLDILHLFFEVGQ